MKLKSSKKRLMAITSMAVGVMIFAGAAFANYSTANGYEVGKTALKNLLKNENYTAELELKFTLDGNEMGSIKNSEVYDRNGDVVINTINEEKASDGSYYYSKRYVQDNTSIHVSKYNDDEEPVTNVNYNADFFRQGNFDVLGDANEEDSDMARKIVRFAELAGDTLVGDLKNNVVYVSGDDDTATYEINLSSVQIPELVNAGLSVVFGQIGGSGDEDDPFAALGTDPIVKSISLKYTVDNQNRLTDGKFNVTLSGNGREAGVDASLVMSYGNAVPERVDIATLPNVHEYTYTARNGYMELEDEDKEVEQAKKEAAAEAAETVEYTVKDSGSVGIIGGADGPTAVYVTPANAADTESETRGSVEIHVDEDGNAKTADGEVVGKVEINPETGEGTVNYFVEK